MLDYALDMQYLAWLRDVIILFPVQLIFDTLVEVVLSSNEELYKKPGVPYAGNIGLKRRHRGQRSEKSERAKIDKPLSDC